MSIDKSKFFISKLELFALLIVYCGFYFPQAFVANDSLSLAAAFEVDPGSIFDSIDKLFVNNFNMLGGYHSSYYGWSFYFIEFLVALPLKIISYNFSAISDSSFYILYRIVFFTIGLLCITSFYKILKYQDKKNISIARLSFIFSFICSPFSSIFYFIHPESTGILFTLLAIVVLAKNPNISFENYISVVILLALSCLAKQIFVFSSLPLFSLALIKNLEPIKDKKFSRACKLFCTAAIVGFVTALVVHPYAFFRFSDFYSKQLALSTSLVSLGAPSFYSSFIKWQQIIIESAPSLMLLIVANLAIMVAGFVCLKRNGLWNIEFVIAGAALITLVAVAYGNRQVFSLHYLAPTYVISLVATGMAAVRYSTSSSRNKRILAFSISLALFILSFSFLPTLYKALDDRLNYRRSSAYISYNYLLRTHRVGDRLVVDHRIAVPDSMKESSCSYWHGCGTPMIYEFKPNFIAYMDSSENVSPKEMAVVKKYITSEGFVEEDAIMIECCNSPPEYMRFFRKVK